MLDNQNESARDKAHTAEADAEISKEHAERASADAQAASERAQQAKQQAATAIDKTISARDAMRSSREQKSPKKYNQEFQKADIALSEARDSLKASESARSLAESSRDIAEQARGAAESARGKAEEARNISEIGRGEAESVRLRAELARQEAELAKQKAEQAQQESLEAAKMAKVALEKSETLAQNYQLLLEEEQQTSKREIMLRTIMQTVHTSLDLDETFQILVNGIGSYLQADRCFISRFDSNSNSLAAPTREYRSSNDIESVLGNTLSLWESLSRFAKELCKQAQPIDFSNKKQGISPEAQSLLQHIRVQSGIGCPIRYRGKCLAVLFIHQVHKEKTWTQLEMDIIQAVSEQAAVAIHQVELFQHERTSRRQQETLAKLNQSALSGMALTDLFNLTTRLVAEALNVPYVKILEHVPNTGHELRFIAVHGFNQELIGQKFEPGSEPHAAYTLEATKPVILEDIHQEKRFSVSSLHIQYGLISGVSVVVYADEKPFGVLEADTDYKRIFTEQEVRFLQSLASVLGLSLQRNKLEEALKTSNQDLEHYAALASHDLQAPLRKVAMFSQQLLQDEKGHLNTQSFDLLQRIHDSIETAQVLVRDLLALSKVAKGGQTFEKVDLSTLMDNVLNNLDEQIREKQAKIEISESVDLIGDANQLEQLLQNLVENGLKYQPEGQIPIIRVSSHCEDRTFCEFVVEDNGIGFEPNQAEQIFKPFERLLHKAGLYPGTGVGLAICKRIVERHGGSISAESKPGQGSKFTVRLPYRPD